MSTRFEWDATKAASNVRKHGISFETALRAFADPLARSEQDRTESGEERWRTLGRVNDCLLLLIAHTVREEKDGGVTMEVIRMISARRADGKETRRYEQEAG